MIEVKWKSDRGYYLMDMSCFAHEQEVVVMDGASFVVEDVLEKSGSDESEFKVVLRHALI